MILDAEQMLRDGSTDLSSTETGDAVHVGPSPAEGALLCTRLPADATTLTFRIEESDTGTGSWSVVDGWPRTITVGAKQYRHKMNWTKKYLRHVVTVCTGNWGAVEIGLTFGRKPKLS